MSADEDWGADLPQDPDDGLAAEFVLRLLDPEEEAGCAARIARDQAFAARVAQWRRDLSSLDVEFEPEALPARLGARIEERLFGRAPSLAARLWASAGLWRGIAVAAVVAAGYFALPGAPPVRLVAAVQGNGVDLLAVYEPARALLTVNRVAGAAQPGRSLELWAVVGDKPPVSLGVLPSEPRAQVGIPPALAAQLGPGAAIAISDEPAGGSPTGQPTNVLAAGKISEI